MYLLILLFPLILIRKWDKNTCLIFIFSLLYTSAFYIRSESLTVSVFIFYSIFPLIAYMTGKYIVTNLKKSPETIFGVVVITALCFASLAIVYNLIDFFKTGNIINVSRLIEYDDGKGLNATGYGVMLAITSSGIGAIFIPASGRYDKIMKRVIVIFGILSILCSIHMVNRTAIVLGLVSIIATLLLPPYKKGQMKFALGIATLIAMFYFFYLKDSIFFSDALASYSARDFDLQSFESGGGRFERWGLALKQIFANPIGDQGLKWGSGYNYAHNMWLDVGIRGGVLSLVILLIITVRYIKSVIRLIPTKLFSTFEKKYLILISLGIILQSFVEPIFESLFQFFLILILCFGIFYQVTTPPKTES